MFAKLFKKQKNTFKTDKHFLSKLKRLPKALKIVLGIILLLLVGVAVFVTMLWQTSKEIPMVERNLDAVLYNVSNEEYEQAYTIFSDEFKQEQDLKTFKKTMVSLKPIYSEYKPKSLQATGFNVMHYIGKPSVLTYSGVISYEDGVEADITAKFISINNKWELVSVYVIAPPSRLDQYINTTENNVEVEE